VPGPSGSDNPALRSPQFGDALAARLMRFAAGGGALDADLYFREPHLLECANEPADWVS